MKKVILGSLASLLASSGLALAQQACPEGCVPAAQPVWAYGNSSCSSRIWASAEYLLWFPKDQPLPFPVVTSTTQPGVRPPVGQPGGLGSPGTVVLLGNENLDMEVSSGVRLTIGSWLNCERTCGMELSGFVLEQRSVAFRANSDANGNPFLGFPIFDAAPDINSEAAIPVTFPQVPPPTQAAGGLVVTAYTQFWGAEANGIFYLMGTDRSSCILIAGFRYAGLQESLNFFGNGTVTDGPGNSVQVIGTDHFGTRNQFYGGQVGTATSMNFGHFDLALVAKVALGTSHNAVNITGNSLNLNPTGEFVGIAAPVTAGSVYSQPTNIGRTTVDRFAVIPEVQLNIGYELTCHTTVFVGYNFLYWSDVVRPGDQIDRVVNDTQRFGGTLVGPARPQPVFHTTDFWENGINFGLEVKY
jgi:hypothetical protein